MEPILIYREDTKYTKEELEKVGNEIKDLQEVFERCADEYPANEIDSIYKEVYYYDEENHI